METNLAHQYKFEPNVRKRIQRMRSVTSQIGLRIRIVWSESSLGAFWIADKAEFEDL